MIKLTDNFQVNKPAPIDDRLGVFASTAEALSSIELDRRFIGLTVVVDTGSGAEEYWFENGIQNGDLTAKSTGGGGGFNCADLLTCTDFTDLQTDVTNLQTDILGLVPYTGATQDVDLGTNNLNSKSVKINGTAGSGHLGLKHQSSNATAQGQETALFAGSDGELYYKNDGLTVAQIASRAWVNLQGFITNVITALGYTPEDVANKQTDLTASATKYPTVNAVNTGLATKVTSNGAITGATKTKITYDSKGLVTAGADLTASDIPILNSYPRVYFVNDSASASVTTLAKIFEGSAINITDMRVGTTFICTGFYTGSGSSTKGFGLSSNNTTPTLATATFTSGQFYFVARYIGGVNGTLRISRVGGAGFGVSATTSYVDINASSGTHTLSFWGSSSTGTIIVEHCLIQMIY